MEVLLDVLLQNLLLVAIILFGSTVHAAAQLRTARGRGVPYSALSFCLDFFIATFAGTLFSLLATEWEFSEPRRLFFAGAGSFLGINGVIWITDRVFKPKKGKEDE